MSDRKPNYFIFLEWSALIAVGWWWRVAESCLVPAEVRLKFFSLVYRDITTLHAYVGSAQDFILLSLYLVLIKRIRRQGEYKIPNINGGKLLRRFSSSYRKLLDRVIFRILSNINGGATLRKYVERL